MTAQLYEQPRPVRIIWHDADSIGEGPQWRTDEEIIEYAEHDTLMETIAFCIGESERYYIFVDTIQTGSEIKGKPHRIPKGCIERMEWLKPDPRVNP